MEKKDASLYYKIGVVGILILALALVLIIKFGRTGAEAGNKAIATRSLDTGQIAVDSVGQEEDTTEIGTVESKPQLSGHILAVVNGEEVTLTALNGEFNALPLKAKEYFKNDKAGFLEELIIKRLLLQDAQHKKIFELSDYKTAVAKNPAQKEQLMINILLRELVANVTIVESELREFFDRNNDQFPDGNYESIKEQVRRKALEEKQRSVIEEHIGELQANAAIVRNREWIREQEAAVADNPVSIALKSGRPVVADFGRGTCIPCKMMLPILEKLQKEYAGRAEILILDIGEYSQLSRKYRVMMIPTQIFFDSSGKEVSRHQGFMAEEDIVAQLKLMAVE
jgi:thioredoxin 1